MIFCQYNYRNFHNENTKKHPIQPYSWENWCKMVDANYRYCKDFNWLKWMKFYFYVWIGRIEKIDVPSFHPYWREEVKKDVRKTLDHIALLYEDCKSHPEKIKYHFNSTTKMRDIEKRIEYYKNELKS